jgi:hypothetical protein
MLPPKCRPARSKIAGNTTYFPIAVVDWLGTAAAIGFIAGRALIQCAGAAAFFSFGERPPRRLAEFAAARAGNRAATCLVIRPLHIHLLVPAGNAAHIRTRRVSTPTRSSPICWAKSNCSC